MKCFIWLLSLRCCSALRIASVSHAIFDRACSQEEWDNIYTWGKAKHWERITHSSCVYNDLLSDCVEGLEDAEDIHEAMVPEHLMNAFHDPRRTVLPKLMYMGLPHAGSSTFARLLNTHPELTFGKRKEHHFWVSNAHGIIHSRPPRYRTFQEYTDEFPLTDTAKYTFDADPDVVFLGNEKLPHGAFKSKPGQTAVEELRNRLGGNMRFILSIRDPVDWIQSLGADGENKNDPIMWNMICLADSLDTWLKFFPNEQFLFLGASENFANVSSAVNRMLRFANLSALPNFVDPSYASGRRRARQIIDNEWRKAYHSDPRNIQCKHRLEAITGLTFSWAVDV